MRLYSIYGRVPLIHEAGIVYIHAVEKDTFFVFVLWLSSVCEVTLNRIGRVDQYFTSICKLLHLIPVLHLSHSLLEIFLPIESYQFPSRQVISMSYWKHIFQDFSMNLFKVFDASILWLQSMLVKYCLNSSLSHRLWIIDSQGVGTVYYIAEWNI